MGSDQHRVGARDRALGSWGGREARDQTSYGLHPGLSEKGSRGGTLRGWEVLSACTPFLLALTYSSTRQLHHFLGSGCAEVMAFGSGPGYKGRDKGYLGRSGQDLMMEGGGEDNYTPRLFKWLVNIPRRRNKGAGRGTKGAQCPVGQGKGSRLKEQGVWKLAGQTGMGALREQGCSGPLRMGERIPATQRPLLPAPERDR